MVGLFIAILIFSGLAVLMRFMATRKRLWVFIPANCYGLVTPQKNTTGDLTKGGGGVVDIVHNIPGKRLVRKGHNLMDWYFEDGRESRSLLFILLGIEWIGPFRYLRTNTIRRFRYAKRTEPDKEKTELFRDYMLEDDDLLTEYVPFSGEQAIVVADAESKKVFELNFLFNVVEENTYPLRSIRVADPNAILAGMIKEKVNALTGDRDPEYFIKASAESTRAIIAAATRSTKDAKDVVGKTILKTNLISTDMDEKDRDLFELEERTELLNAAKLKEADRKKQEVIIESEGRKQAGINDNTVLDQRVAILERAAANDRVSANFRTDRLAAAYEENTTVTTLVTGPGHGVLVPSK